VLGFIVHTFVSAILLFVVGRMVSGVEVRDGKVAIYGALGLGLANAFVRPLLLKLTLPITILTLGLFVWVINALMLMLVAAFVDGFDVDDFPSALVASLLFGIMNFLVGMLLG
jgi:putative membrane protein